MSYFTGFGRKIGDPKKKIDCDKLVVLMDDLLCADKFLVREKIVRQIICLVLQSEWLSVQLFINKVKYPGCIFNVLLKGRESNLKAENMSHHFTDVFDRCYERDTIDYVIGIRFVREFFQSEQLLDRARILLDVLDRAECVCYVSDRINIDSVKEKDSDINDVSCVDEKNRR